MAPKTITRARIDIMKLLQTSIMLAIHCNNHWHDWRAEGLRNCLRNGPKDTWKLLHIQFTRFTVCSTRTHHSPALKIKKHLNLFFLNSATRAPRSGKFPVQHYGPHDSEFKLICAVLYRYRWYTVCNYVRFTYLLLTYLLILGIRLFIRLFTRDLILLVMFIGLMLTFHCIYSRCVLSAILIKKDCMVLYCIIYVTSIWLVMTPVCLTKSAAASINLSSTTSAGPSPVNTTATFISDPSRDLRRVN